jgi:hypothetical protein
MDKENGLDKVGTVNAWNALETETEDAKQSVVALLVLIVSSPLTTTARDTTGVPSPMPVMASCGAPLK